MTLTVFASLSAEVQLEVVEDNGVHVGQREHPNHCIHLYRVYNFYVEVFIRKKGNTVWKIGGFDHPVLLDPYLDQIDLSDLLT